MIHYLVASAADIARVCDADDHTTETDQLRAELLIRIGGSDG